MNVKEIKEQIDDFRQSGKKMFTTTSLQTHSMVLLHILKQVAPDVQVFFVNTGYHFPETILYRDTVSKELGIEIKILNSPVSKHLQRDSKGNLLFTSDPDLCCHYNKVLPVDNLLLSYDIWINGVRAAQSENRKLFHTQEQSAHSTLRFHPILDWTDQMIENYIAEHKLPRHPLENKGYSSIGCEPCTRRKLTENIRDSRWFGLNKTECGLNTELIDKP